VPCQRAGRSNALGLPDRTVQVRARGFVSCVKDRGVRALPVIGDGVEQALASGRVACPDCGGCASASVSDSNRADRHRYARRAPRPGAVAGGRRAPPLEARGARPRGRPVPRKSARTAGWGSTSSTLVSCHSRWGGPEAEQELEPRGGRELLVDQTSSGPLVSGASAPQPADTPELGTHGPPRGPMVASGPTDASVSQRAIRRSYPRAEPSALAVHAGICAGAGRALKSEGPSLPRSTDLGINLAAYC